LIKNLIKIWLSDSVKVFQTGQLLKQAAVWVSSVIIAKSSISLQDIGQLEWIFFLGFSFSFFWLSSIIQLFLKTSNEIDHSLNDSFSNYFSLTIVISIFTGCFYAIWGFFNHIDNYILISIYLFILGPSSWIHYLWFKKKPGHLQFMFSLLYFLGNILAVYYGSWISKSLSAILVGLIVLQFVSTTLCLPYYKPKFHITSITNILNTNFKWLSGIAMLGGLSVVIDGVLVKLFFSEPSNFAIYRYGARELPLAAILLTALGQASIPGFTTSLTITIVSFKKRTNRLMMILFPIYTIFLIVSNLLFKWFYGGQFSEAVILFDVMLLVIILRFINTNSLIISINKESALFWIAFKEIVINIAVSLILLPFMGLVGIVIGTLISFTYERIASVKLLQENNIAIGTYLPVKTFILFGGLIVSVFIAKQFLLTIF
jgi:O-antigen/teichoic acid export membrane protein